MSALSPSALTAMRLNAESDTTSWTRPRRQTNPDLVHRPSVLLRQATRRSADVSSSPSSPLTPDQRPRTAHTHVSSSATATPTKRHSGSSHRSSLSVSALSNPALAEIPSRKYNALRLSTGSVDGSPERSNINNNHHNHAGLGTPRDPAAPATSNFNFNGNPNSMSNDSSSSSSYFPQSSPSSELRPSSSSSASTRRAPASAFTPPAFQDRLLRPPQTTTQESPSIDAVLKSNKSILKKAGSTATLASPSRRRRGSTPLSPRSGPSRMDPTITGSFEEQSADELKDYSTDDTRSRSDDIFLNIAKSSVSSRRDSLGKLDRRRKLGLSTRSSLVKEQSPSPEQLKYQSSPLYSQNASPLFTSNYSTSASAHPLDDNSRLRHLNSSSRSVINVPRSRYNRDLSPELPQLPLPDLKTSIADARFRYSNISNLSSRTVRQASPSDGEKTRHDGTTESSLSTTAPSTVWDELDDLKSRIRKLELTGKFPLSSAAAMSSVSGERPRTATTTATTLSSSPKQKHTRKSSVTLETTSAATTTNSIQTLLQSALTKAKPVVGPDVFNALEATATDALTLTNMLASTSTPTLSTTVSTVTGTGLSDRQAKRKADSLCRGLTELCLALTEEQTICQPSSQQEQTRPTSRHQSTIDSHEVVHTRFRRSMSHELKTSNQQEDPGSRLFSHRANTINLGPSSGHRELSHDEKVSPQTPSLAAPPSRLHRLSGSNRLKREDDSEERNPVFNRTLPSRAMTEVGGYSQNQLSRDGIAADSPSTRLSTPYQQTLSQQSKISPSIQSSITQRRSYATPLSAGSGIPSTSGFKIQPGFRRYGASTMAGLSDRGTSESPRQAGENSAPTASHALQNTRISAPSSKMATSYTAIQQPRLRSENVVSRRLSLRPRPSTIGMNGDR
ncbi:hypothetical protein UA08_04227 [Talaromyces atroroseus]|uniref:LPXTG-motif cell wall anchor domain protein n=1 Tax=Talaromyces atroroseus TaxID=1441469 RepID=A0A1Q5Q968_TALAT|nr:hypothetical protein UA08_04227 [Talaromyces atroroseus]OKL60655.1 hypothetical protein UA08_04227 [Talaromyces atroroseus]